MPEEACGHQTRIGQKGPSLRPLRSHQQIYVYRPCEHSVRTLPVPTQRTCRGNAISRRVRSRTSGSGKRPPVPSDIALRTTSRSRSSTSKPRQLNSDAFDLEPKSMWMFKNSLTVFGSNSKYRLNLKVSESLSESRVQPSHMCKIAYCFGRWCFIVPEIAEQHRGGYVTASGEEEKIVGIDPGLRKAFTCVSNSGRIDEIGIKMSEAMKKLKSKGKAILAASCEGSYVHRQEEETQKRLAPRERESQGPCDGLPLQDYPLPPGQLRHHHPGQDQCSTTSLEGPESVKQGYVQFSEPLPFQAAPYHED